MNEQEQMSQLSALYDGELPPEQADLVIRRALKDSSLRTSWERYALIGACLRGGPIAGGLPQTDVAGRVRTRLVAEAEHGVAAGAAPASAVARRRLSTFGRGALGGAIAAGVAAVALVLVRGMAPEPAATQLARQTTAPAVVPGNADAATSPVQVAANDTPPSYVTPPVDDSPGRRVSAPMVNYVVAHSEVAPSVVRLSPLFSVMNDSYDPTQDTVEMTAAEVGARR